jgi:outer membrane receptor for ferrienterochelin and colicin
LDSLKLRGTWGTSFRAPPFYLAGNGDIGSYVAQVPDASGKLVDVLSLYGLAPGLTPEKADVWTAGFDLVPLQNFVASVTYFNIDYRDRIQFAGPETEYLTQPQLYSSVTTLNPTQAQLDALCGPGGPYPVYPGLGECAGPLAAILDGTVRNLSLSKTQGVDAEAHYSLPTSRGSWNFGLNGTYTFSFRKQITVTAPVVNVVDTVANPLKLRAVGTVGWSLGGWSTQATVNFTGAYRDTNSVPARAVDSWTTVDLSVGYRTGSKLSWLSDTDLHLGAINLFDKRPPFVNQYLFAAGVLAYDAANASILGRMVSLQATRKW